MNEMMRTYAPQVPGSQPAMVREAPADFQPMAPATFWEWFCRVYDPNEYVYNWQFYFLTLKPGAGASVGATINIQVPIFAFEFRSKFWFSSNGAVPTFPYRIGIAMQSTNDWTFGQWASPVITGDQGQSMDYRFAWPREVPASTNLTITVNNALNGANALEGDAGIVGLEPRKRNVPLVDKHGRFTGSHDGMGWGSR